MVSTFEIFRLQRAHIMCFKKEVSDPGIKRFKPSKFFACGGLISCVLVKEMSDPEIKGYKISHKCF